MVLRRAVARNVARHVMAFECIGVARRPVHAGRIGHA
jgi:hypothetical protein